MKLPVLSIRTIFGIIIILMGVVALILAMLTGSIHRDLVLENQKSMIREMINISVKERLKDLNTISKDLGLALQSTIEFQNALQRKDKKTLNNLLNNQFHQYFVTTGVIELQQLVLLDKDFVLIQEASEGYVFFKNTSTCQNLINQAKNRSRTERMKTIQGLCLYHNKPVNVVLVPAGGLRLKGYILVVVNPVHNLKALEQDLGMPLALRTHDNSVAFKSDKWPINENHTLVSDFEVKTSFNEEILTVLTAQDLSQLSASLSKSRIEVFLLTGFFTFVVIILSIYILRKTMLNPLHNLAVKIRNFDSDKWTEDSRIENYGVKEIGELGQGFNFMAAAQQKAQKSDLQKSKFLANMSHEIRTPLAAIIGYSETIYNNGITKDWRKYLSRILSNGKHLNQLINDILDLSKIEADQLAVEQLSVNVGTVLFDLESIIGEQANNKGLEFKIKYHYPIPETITTDPTRLKQILINLCGNAVKFTDKGNIVLSVSYNEPDNQMKFSIKDNGIGMTEEQLAGLFKPFTQADSSITRKYGGTGLGLHISKLLAEKLGGNIVVSSIVGVGSHFEVSVDAGKISEKSIFSDSDINAVSHSENILAPQLDGTILLAEDNLDNQNLISLYIEETGAQVDCANNGKIALEKAGEKKYDLILMDMQMPVMGGIEAIKKLRAQNIDTPIAVLTANAMKEDFTLSEQAGAEYFLTKPVNKNEFYVLLSEHLPGKKSEPVTPMKEEQSSGDRLQKLTEKFINQLPEKNRELKEYYENQDWDAFASSIHNLKGTGSAFGFPLITEYSGLIEQKIRQHQYDDIKSLYLTLTNLIDDIRL